MVFICQEIEYARIAHYKNWANDLFSFTHHKKGSKNVDGRRIFGFANNNC